MSNYHPPVFVNGVMGGLQTMFQPVGFSPACQVLVSSARQAAGKLKNTWLPSPRTERARKSP